MRTDKVKPKVYATQKQMDDDTDNAYVGGLKRSTSMPVGGFKADRNNNYNNGDY